MTFEQWMKAQDPAIIKDAFSAAAGWRAGQDAMAEDYEEGRMTLDRWLESEGFENKVTDNATMYGGCVLIDCWKAAQAAERQTMQAVIEAAEAVIARWDSPKWKDQEPTGAVIHRLRVEIEKLKEEE